MYALQLKFSFVFIGLILSVFSCTNIQETKQSQLKTEIISLSEIGSSMVRVQAKFTNVSGKHINRAKGTAIIYDKNHNEIGFKTHYVIKSTEGGLKPNATTRFSFVVNVTGKASTANIEVKIL